jgi:hypothetical protein
LIVDSTNGALPVNTSRRDRSITPQQHKVFSPGLQNRTKESLCSRAALCVCEGLWNISNDKSQLIQNNGRISSKDSAFMPSVQTNSFSATAGAVSYVNAQTDPISAGLPDATADINDMAPAGKVVCRIYLQAAPKYPVTAVPAEGQTVNGQSSLSLPVPGLYEFLSDGANLLCVFKKLVGAPGWGG